MHFTSSTMGITKIANPIATPYSVQLTGVNPKALATTGTSSTTVVSTSEPSIAPHSTLLWVGSENTLLRWERILKLWNISHILMVKNAMVMPSSDTPLGISK